MTLSPTPVFTLWLFVYLAGMVQVWAWMLGHQIRRHPVILPEFVPSPRRIPWGIGTIVLVLVVYLAVNLGALELYLLSTGRQRREIVPPPIKAKADPSKKDIPKAEVQRSGHAEIKTATDESEHRDKDEEDSLLSVTEGMFLLTLINEALILILPVLLRLSSGGTLRDLGLTFQNWGSQLKIGAAGALFIAPIVYMIQFLATRYWTSNDHPVQDMVRNQFTPGVAYLAGLSAVVMAPIVEEILFRGILQNWLFKLAIREAALVAPTDQPVFEDRQLEAALAAENAIPSEEPTAAQIRRASRQAILTTSFFFAIVHYQQWPAPIPIFLLSLALGILYQLTGSLLASIAMHATFNSISTLMLFLAMSSTGTEAPAKEVQPRSVMMRILGNPVGFWNPSEKLCVEKTVRKHESDRLFLDFDQ